MNRRITVIVNPCSGTLKKQGLEKWLPDHIRAMGYDVELRHTAAPGDATRIAAECAACGDYGVVACGGDGTVNEVACGLVNTQTALGILPAGSGNGLARHIGVPADIYEALKILEQNHIESCDYGIAGDRPFFCAFGMGFDAAVTRRYSTKRRRGLNSYLKSAIEEIATYNPAIYEISVNGEVVVDRAFLVAVCNASQYGNNAFIAPKASIKDGLLDVIVVHDGNFIEKARMGFELLAGLIGNHGGISVFRVGAVEIRCRRPEAAHCDGEALPPTERVEIRCMPQALRVFTPRYKARFVPVWTPIVLGMREVGTKLGRIFRRH